MALWTLGSDTLASESLGQLCAGYPAAKLAGRLAEAGRRATPGQAVVAPLWLYTSSKRYELTN